MSFLHLEYYIDSSVFINMLKRKQFFLQLVFFLLGQLLGMISEEITAFITSYTLHAQCNFKPI